MYCLYLLQNAMAKFKESGKNYQRLWGPKSLCRVPFNLQVHRTSSPFFFAPLVRKMAEETGEEIQEITQGNPPSIPPLRSQRDASPTAKLFTDNNVEPIPQLVLNVKSILRLQIFQ